MIYEAQGQGGELSTYLIRTLVSEGEVRYLTVDPALGTREIVKKGPTNFITTTTQPELHAENETRYWTVLVNDSPRTTRKVLALQADQASGQVQEHPVSGLHEVFLWLRLAGVKDAVVPFAPALAEAMPAQPVRLRRDFPRLLQLVKVCALLHQRQRQRDAQGRVVAELADYAMVRALVAPVFDRAVRGITEKTTELVDALERVLANKGEGARVGYEDLVRVTRRNKSYISRWLQPALEHGVVVNDNAGMNGRTAALHLGVSIEDGDEGVLPTAQQLARQVRAAADWINPLNGRQERCGVAVRTATVPDQRNA